VRLVPDAARAVAAPRLGMGEGQTSLPAKHQCGLQIAEDMVTFFESYEREVEKYWAKTLFFQLS
jgi:hypothetical protein